MSSAYKDSLLLASNQFKSALDESVPLTETSLSAVTSAVSSYINNHPLNSYVDSSSFREAVSKYSTDVRSLISNYISRSTNGDVARIDNAELDFNSAVNNANNAFYDGLNSVIITDPDYSTKFQTVKTSMDEYTQNIIDQVSAASSEHQSTILDMANSVRESCIKQLDDFVYDRPLLRVIDFRYPIEVVLNGYNTIEVDVKNVGRKPWTGWIGVTVTDEYYKKLEFISQVGSNSTINPNETRTLKRDIELPKVVTWKGEPRNLGKTLTYKVLVNTVLE